MSGAYHAEPFTIHVGGDTIGLVAAELRAAAEACDRAIAYRMQT